MTAAKFTTETNQIKWKLLKYDKKCITLLGCTGLRKTAYQFLFRSLREWIECTINDRTIF